MGMHMITAHGGKQHITSADAGAYNAGIAGSGKYVLETGNQFAAEIVSNNVIKIKSGDLINRGRHARIAVNDYEEVTIENGTQSTRRNDLIVARYKKNTDTQIETTELVVLKGTPTSSVVANNPSYISGNILEGATQDDFPLYRVSLNGLNITSVTKLFSVLPSVEKISGQIRDAKLVDEGNLLTEFPCESNVISRAANGFVTLSVQMNTGAIGANAGNWWTAGTIPDGFRPGEIVYGSGIVCEEGWVNAVSTAFMATPDGLLYLYGQNSNATMLAINMTYVVPQGVVD